MLVVFILLFLKPFDTGEKYLPNKNLVLTGYGICILLSDLILVAFERLVVLKLKKYWTLAHEVGYLISLFLLSSILVYCYDIAFTKKSVIEWDYLLTFSYQFILPLALLLLPAIGYYRYKNGKVLAPEQIQKLVIQLRGENQSDVLELKLHELICIKAEDNYVRIIYWTEKSQIKELLMRNTLANMQKQVQPLRYCHRSYLIASWNIKQIEGHKQKARLIMKHYEQEIPLSTKYFNTISRLTKL
jgi:hypothetical protein